MKVEINRSGRMHIICESETETFAVQKWMASSTVTIQRDNVGFAQFKGDQHWFGPNLQFDFYEDPEVMP